MSSITEYGSNSPIILRSETTSAAKESEYATGAGAGINGEVGAVPEAAAQTASQSAVFTLTFRALLKSVDDKLPTLSADDSAVLVLEVAVSLDKHQKQVLEGDINAKTGQQRDDLRELGKQLEKMLKQIDEANKKSGIAKAFSQAFGYILGGLMVIVGAALMATGVGAVAGGVLAASGALMIADQATKDTTGKGIGGQIATAVGGNVMAGEIGFSVGVAVGSAVAGGFAVSAIKVAQVPQWVNTAKGIGMAAAGATQVVNGSLSIDAAVTQSKATSTRADNEEMQAAFDQNQQFIDAMLKILMGAFAKISDVVESGASSLQEKGKSFAHVKF